MNRLRTAVVGLALVGLVSGCARLDAFSSLPAHTSGSSATSSAPTSSRPTPAPSTTAPATTAPVAPAHVVEPAQAPIGPPTTYFGSGDGVLTVTKPAGATAVIATISGNAAARNFDVRAIDGAQDHLVATTSPYTGSTILDAAGTSTHQLRIHGVGPWSITLTDVRSAPAFTLGYGGTGDAVIQHVGDGGTGLDAAQGAGTAFSVRAYRLGSVTSLVDETGPWSGTVRWPAGAAIVTVRAVGPWSISVDHR